MLNRPFLSSVSAANTSAQAVRCVLLTALALAGLKEATHAQSSDLVWAGLVHEMLTLNGDELWTVEDGGRVRHRDASGVWTFQITPTQDTLRKNSEHTGTLPGAMQHLWAVDQGGQVFLKAGNGPWTWHWEQLDTALPGTPLADLWDVREVDLDEPGMTNLYLLGLHGIWRIDDPHAMSISSTEAIFVDALGQLIDGSKLELYSFDFAHGYGLACGEPGLIFRQDVNPDVWIQTLDVRTLGGNGTLPACANTSVGLPGASFEMWDLEISRSTDPLKQLAVAVGGIGTACGVAFTSTDQGFTWIVERHECRCPSGWSGCNSACASDPAYNEDGNPGTPDVWRLEKFNTLYDVGILHGDNTAIACGYGGQIVVRDPTDANSATPAIESVWRDRTAYSDQQLTTPTAITMPQNAVATNGGDRFTGKAWVAGQGGYIRKSVNGGQDWTTVNSGAFGETNTLPADHWRIRDVHFVDEQTGWMVAQFHVIQRTIDGGANWTQDFSQPQKTKPFLNAITMDAGPAWGVAVGQAMPATLLPSILYIEGPSIALGWSEPSNMISPPGISGGELLDVDWASGNEFWAVGTMGLIYRSNASTGPEDWSFVVPDGEGSDSFSNCTLDGVAFAGANHGVFVGSRLIGGTNVGAAYAYDGLAPLGSQWATIDISDPNVVALTDVDFDGAAAFATGLLTDGNGVVLKATRSGGSFTPFTVLQSFAKCEIGEVPNVVAPLTEIEIAPGGVVWVGGQCGRLWRSSTGASWLPHAGASDAHVRGMSFVSAPGGYVGYIAGHRTNRTCQSIVKIVP